MEKILSKNVVVESYKDSDKTTYIVRVPGDNNQFNPVLITHDPVQLTEFFDKIL